MYMYMHIYLYRCMDIYIYIYISFSLSSPHTHSLPAGGSEEDGEAGRAGIGLTFQKPDSLPGVVRPVT